MQAAGLFEREIKPPEVARRLRVSRKSVYQWHQLWRDGGTAGRRGRGSGLAWPEWISMSSVSALSGKAGRVPR